MNYNIAGAGGGRLIDLTTVGGTLPANGTAGVQLNLGANLAGLGGDTFNVPANHIINVQSTTTGALLNRGGNVNLSPDERGPVRGAFGDVGQQHDGR